MRAVHNKHECRWHSVTCSMTSRMRCFVPPDDPQAIAAAVHRLLTEPGLAARLSHNARRKAAQFDWSSVLPQWERVLASLISEAGRG